MERACSHPSAKFGFVSRAQVSSFLTPEECERVVRAACADDVEECTEYLNHRVNADGEVEASGYDEEQAAAALAWGDRAETRPRVPACRVLQEDDGSIQIRPLVLFLS